MIGLAAFTNPWTALLFLAAFAIFAVLVGRFYERHHLAGRYDSKLTDERMARARERWILERGEQKRASGKT